MSSNHPLNQVGWQRVQGLMSSFFNHGIDYFKVSTDYFKTKTEHMKMELEKHRDLSIQEEDIWGLINQKCTVVGGSQEALEYYAIVGLFTHAVRPELINRVPELYMQAVFAVEDADEFQQYEYLDGIRVEPGTLVGFEIEEQDKLVLFPHIRFSNA